ncbi:hypothetical protein PG987_015884 [Apiospora arundinis]
MIFYSHLPPLDPSVQALRQPSLSFTTLIRFTTSESAAASSASESSPRSIGAAAASTAALSSAATGLEKA